MNFLKIQWEDAKDAITYSASSKKSESEIKPPDTSSKSRQNEDHDSSSNSIEARLSIGKGLTPSMTSNFPFKLVSCNDRSLDSTVCNLPNTNSKSAALVSISASRWELPSLTDTKQPMNMSNYIEEKVRRPKIYNNDKRKNKKCNSKTRILTSSTLAQASSFELKKSHYPSSSALKAPKSKYVKPLGKDKFLPEDLFLPHYCGIQQESLEFKEQYMMFAESHISMNDISTLELQNFIETTEREKLNILENMIYDDEYDNKNNIPDSKKEVLDKGDDLIYDYDELDYD